MTDIPNFSPREIVDHLDKYIVGQDSAKRLVAVALRNRWRRQQLDEEMREEIYPKNILMIGPTGCGKTEIARRLAKLADAPFIKVEATKFTEIGYVGRDVEQIIRDLLEHALHMVRDEHRKDVLTRAEINAEDRVLDALTGANASEPTKDKFRKQLREGTLDDTEIEVNVQDSGSMQMPMFDIPGMPGGQMGMMNLGDILGKSFGTPTKKRTMSVGESYDILLEEESSKLIDQEKITKEAIQRTEQLGIVFLDEIDKTCHSADNHRGDVSREGVQRDLLPLIEGTTVSTKHGQVKTDHILFITSGAFHAVKPSDLMPELQGRLPIRVTLNPLKADDFCRILTEPKNALIAQYQALLATEQVTLKFTDDAIRKLADLAEQINDNVENIGARRLHTVLEKLLEEISFSASDKEGETIKIDAKQVEEKLGPLVKSADLSKFIL
ncbi:MAG: ATP-dependent protease ATPase subunit HslU [Alphaproteobacteria bacterium]|nr:ATP-dependent protease ATPase subunit HslU [Alphaproteobacteria bacterium]